MALDIDQRVVLKSRVDTGRYRSNWLVGLGAPRRDTTETLDKTGSKAIVDAANTIGRSRAYQDIWISNNVSYAFVREFGSEYQMADHTAELAVKEALRAN